MRSFRAPARQAVEDAAMATRIARRAPQARCYKCGSTSITRVCHHCGRAMCSAHAPQLSGIRGRPLSAEFADLGLKGTRCGEAPVHCDDCAHIVRTPHPLWIGGGALVALVGAALFRQRFSLAALLLI